MYSDYEELYGRPGHFLHELLQNADDVEYDNPDPEPTFSITTQAPFDFVRFDCNETGFTRKNVHSICRSRMSSKSSEATGEKGTKLHQKRTLNRADLIVYFVY